MALEFTRALVAARFGRLLRADEEGVLAIDSNGRTIWIADAHRDGS